MTETIKFGTDGWRAIIGGEFTFANVRRVAGAMARYVITQGTASQGLVIGYDARFLSPQSAREAAELASQSGVPVLLAEGITPTPALSYAVAVRKAAGGIMITASHNPCQWNGIKFKAPYGGSAAPPIVQEIEKLLPPPGNNVKPAGLLPPARVQMGDLVDPYLARIKTMVNLSRIRASGMKFAIDPMYGAARGLITRIFEEAAIPVTEIHSEHNPLFPGLNPEPIEPHVADLRHAVLEGGYSAGLATDGDADRIGAVDRSGMFVDSHKIFCILLSHLAGDMGKRGEVVRTFSTTTMVDKIARKYNLPLHVTPIGFKYVCELMLKRDVLIGGEESGGIGIQGHLPERDGILNSLLLAEVMAEKGRTLGELVQELNGEYGPHYYGRVDIEIGRTAIDRTLRLVGDRKITSVAGRAVRGVEDLDGLKMVFGDSIWLLVRASGTENMLRLYAEAPSPEEVKKMLDEMADVAKDSPPAA
ncbi:MAG: phosphoglucomutase/phosphomannomutase family protein [Acidobacteriota bacterium]|nr:phosphoglucomutase/phosphomannomutase family protein [Acidobacteriota bacterium]